MVPKKQRTMTPIIAPSMTNDENEKSSAMINMKQKQILWLILGFLLGSQFSMIDTLRGFLSIEEIDATTTSLDAANVVDNNTDLHVLPTRHWCVVAKGYVSGSTEMYFQHFPHAAEVLLPCWSYFRQQNATNRCGFALMDGFFLPENSWQKQLVDAMGCEVRYYRRPLPPTYVNNNGTKFVEELPDEDVQYIPNRYLLKPRYPSIRYLFDEEDAHALRRFFISDSQIAKVKGDGKPLQIGLLQRPKSRRITNLEEIKDELQKALPESHIDLSDFQYLNITDQATWFATKDVIVGAHGAGLTNSIFITKGTIVLQVWPENWFWQSLDTLIEDSGGIALDWYKKDVHPVVAFMEARKTGAQNKGSKGTITPPVNEIVGRILLALGKMPANTANLNAIRDSVQ